MNRPPTNQKDRAPSDTIQTLREILNSMGISLYESSWNSFGDRCFSVRLIDTAYPAAATNGKGITRELALASAYGEFIERFQNFRFGAGPTVAITLQRCFTEWFQGKSRINNQD